MAQSTDQYELLTTTRYDPTLSNLSWNNDCDGPSPFFLLPSHFERLQAASQEHRWSFPSELTYPRFKAVIADEVSKQSGPTFAYRIRVLLHKTGQLQVAATPLEATFTDDPFLFSTFSDLHDLQVPLINVHVDRAPTAPSIFTQTKTTFRTVYDEARLRNALQPLTSLVGRSSEVLLHNALGFVMETSIFNIAFLRGSRWLTPHQSSGCLPGVARRWLLEHGRIDEDTDGTLTVASIKEGEIVLLFNGVQGCRLGKIVKHP